jgi:hypothetical protein
LKKSFAHYLLLCFILSAFVSCRKEPIDPDTHVAGQIAMGETGNSIVSFSYSTGQLIGGSYGNFDLPLDTVDGIPLSITVSSGSASGTSSNVHYNYRSAEIRPSDQRVEIASDLHSDSTWMCSTWLPDSSEHHSLSFNRTTYVCAGTLSNGIALNYQTPTPYVTDAVIDATANWSFANCMLATVNRETAYTQVNNYVEYSELDYGFGFELGKGYRGIGFRWAVGGGRFKYGYLLLNVSIFGDVTVKTWGREI